MEGLTVQQEFTLIEIIITLFVGITIPLLGFLLRYLSRLTISLDNIHSTVIKLSTKLDNVLDDIRFLFSDRDKLDHRVAELEKQIHTQSTQIQTLQKDFSQNEKKLEKLRDVGSPN